MKEKLDMIAQLRTFLSLVNAMYGVLPLEHVVDLYRLLPSLPTA